MLHNEPAILFCATDRIHQSMKLVVVVGEQQDESVSFPDGPIFIFMICSVFILRAQASLNVHVLHSALTHTNNKHEIFFSGSHSAKFMHNVA